MATGFTHKAMVWLGLTDDYEDYGPAYEEPPPAQVSPRRPVEVPDQPVVSVVRPVPVREMPDPTSGLSLRGGVVRPIAPTQSPKVHVVAPVRFADAQEIGDRFKASQPVIVNLQNAESSLSRRMVDFVSGLTYALTGSMEKVADQVFLLTPSNVEVSADERRKLEERGLYHRA